MDVAGPFWSIVVNWLGQTRGLLYVTDDSLGLLFSTFSIKTGFTSVKHSILMSKIQIFFYDTSKMDISDIKIWD